MPGRTFGRPVFRLAHLGLTVATAVTDTLPARLRFGHARTAAQLLFQHGDLIRLTVPSTTSASENRAVVAQSDAALRCVLVTASLGVGGVESVVALLARHLPEYRVAATVVAREGGATVDSLRREGVNVLVAPSDEELAATVAGLSPDIVQVHTATAGMCDALIATGLPLVTVLHSVELYRSPAAWQATMRLDQASRAVVAVSSAVRDDHLTHIASRTADEVVLIPNGATTRPADHETRARARARLADVLGVNLGDDTVALCLARYDIQKNVPGLVDGFLLAAERVPRMRLIVAGSTADWLERAKAEALRRSHAAGTRVHLLAESDAPTLLAAADLFVLDSFFEGWPVSVTEAVCAGLPVVMSDVGGAHELLAGHPERGLVVPNPAGPRLTPNSVAAARRALHQRTRAVLARAIADVSQLPRSGVGAPFIETAAVTAHARVLAGAARTRG